MTQTLKTTAMTYLCVDHTDLEQFIGRHCGRPYSVVAALGACSDTLCTVRVDADHCGSADDTVRAWRDGGPYEPDLDDLMHHLACTGAIPAGDYLISVL
ncbi:hypothetical protein [Streptomyces sp. NPDC001889]